MTQTTFDLSKAENRKASGRHLARRMIAILAVREQWTTRKVFKSYGLTDRECRLGRSASNGRIIKSGRGFKLLRNATEEEIRESQALTLSMIESLQEDWAKVNRRAHKAIHEKEN